jgi:hypothetical protein
MRHSIKKLEAGSGKETAFEAARHELTVGWQRANPPIEWGIITPLRTDQHSVEAERDLAKGRELTAECTESRRCEL